MNSLRTKTKCDSIDLTPIILIFKKMYWYCVMVFSLQINRDANPNAFCFHDNFAVLIYSLVWLFQVNSNYGCKKTHLKKQMCEWGVLVFISCIFLSRTNKFEMWDVWVWAMHSTKTMWFYERKKTTHSKRFIWSILPWLEIHCKLSLSPRLSISTSADERQKNVCIQCYVVIVKEYSSVHNRPQSRHESVCFARLCLLIRARVCVGVSIYAHDGDVASVCSLLITAISMRSVQCSGNRARAHVLSFALRSPIYTYNKYTTCVFLCKTERDKCIRAACLLLDCVTINNSESNNNSNSSNKPFSVQRKQHSHSIKLKAKPKQTTSTTTTPKEITARQRSVYVVLVQQ